MNPWYADPISQDLALTRPLRGLKLRADLQDRKAEVRRKLFGLQTLLLGARECVGIAQTAREGRASGSQRGWGRVFPGWGETARATWRARSAACCLSSRTAVDSQSCPLSTGPRVKIRCPFGTLRPIRHPFSPARKPRPIGSGRARPRLQRAVSREGNPECRPRDGPVQLITRRARRVSHVELPRRFMTIFTPSGPLSSTARIRPATTENLPSRRARWTIS